MKGVNRIKMKKYLYILAIFIASAMLVIWVLNTRAQPVENVRVTRPFIADINDYLTISGVVLAKHDTNVTSSASAQVAKIYVVPGQSVKKGDILIQQEDSDTRIELEISKATLALRSEEFRQKQRELHLQTRLAKAGGSSLESVDVAAGEVSLAKSHIEVAHHNVILAENAVKKRVVKAPYDGMVKDLHVDILDWSSLGQPLLSLLDLSSMEVEVYVYIADVALLKEGLRAEIFSDAHPDTKSSGLVSYIARSVNENDSNTITVRVVLNEPTELLKVGELISVKFLVEGKRDVLQIPIEALVEKANNDYSVFTVVDGQLKSIPVTVGIENVSFVEIMGDVTDQQIIALPNHKDFVNGMPVKVISE